MNFELKGKFHDYYIEDDKITISKKKDIIYTGNISDIVLLCFVEKNALGAGQIALSLPNSEKAFIDSFRKEHRDGFVELFQVLKNKTNFLNLNYMEAVKYVKPEIMRERELKENAEEIQKAAKEEQRKEKMQLLKKGFKLIDETKCVCTQCNAVWFYGNQDKLDDISNRLISAGALMQGKSLTSTYHEQLI
jgi:hypothetical protein